LAADYLSIRAKEWGKVKFVINLRIIRNLANTIHPSNGSRAIRSPIQWVAGHSWQYPYHQTAFFFPGGGDVLERHSVINKEGLEKAGYEIAIKKQPTHLRINSEGHARSVNGSINRLPWLSTRSIVFLAVTDPVG
jgi:hypothetical protein